MTISCVIGHFRNARWLLPGAFALLAPITVHALQTAPRAPPRPAPMVLLPPPAAVQFQHIAQQQQLRDQLQNRQLQQQLQRGVAGNAKRPLPPDSPTRNQLEQAAAARANRDRAAQQDLLDRFQRANVSLSVLQLQPAGAHSGR